MNGGTGLPPHNLASLYAGGGLPVVPGDYAAQQAAAAAHFGLGASMEHGLAPPGMMVPYGLPAGALPGLNDVLRVYTGLPPLMGGLVNGESAMDAFQREAAAAALAENLEQLQLNPMAKEFVPPSMRGGYGRGFRGGLMSGGGRGQPRYNSGGGDGSPSGRSGAGNGRVGAGSRGGGGASTSNSGSGGGRGRGRGGKKKSVQRGLEDNVRRTVYICDIDQQVTEEQLANVFADCGQVIDCRVCGDPNSAMRFAFIEFTSEESAQKATSKSGTVLGHYPLRVLPSKTAIVPVNHEYLPRGADEREQCGRTVYAANIDRKVDKNDVRTFFETLCGPVSKIRLLGDSHHSTRIAFVEFAKAESAKAALNCSGALLGSLPIRVSPSKTPVRADQRSSED